MIRSALIIASVLFLGLFNFANAADPITESGKPDRKSVRYFWSSTVENAVNSGVPYFSTHENEMYEIKGYMQQNTELTATFNSAYENWGFVVINAENAHIYNEFFELFLPRMQDVMYEHANTNGILIDEQTYNLAIQIVNEHSSIDDPGFVSLKNKLVNDLNVLKNQNYSAVRAWFRGELY